MNSTPENVAPDAEQRVTTLPMGCYYATQSPEDTTYRLLIKKILAHDVTPPMSVFTDAEQIDLRQMSDVGLITLDEPQTSLPLGNLGHLMKYALPALSVNRRVLLSESHHALIIGFTGFTEEHAEELAVLAGQIHSIDDLNNRLKKPKSLNNHTVGLIDSAGGGDLGFWPIHIADQLFCLTIEGTPQFNCDQFALLIWGLVERYGYKPQ